MLDGRHGDNLSKEKNKMNNFQYVSRKQLSPVKQDLIQIIKSVQNQVRKDFTFRFDFVGSTQRNMATYNVGTNIGYDFDVNIQVNDDECKFSAKEIKTKIRLALDKVAFHYGYDNAEDSTRVITIKVKDRKNSKILHSCDFAIVNDYVDDNGSECQEYIHFNKKKKTYTWQEQPQGFYLLPPIYPVVSMTDKSTHRRSRRGLLGEGKAISAEMKDSLSLERHVRRDMPPVYLMNCIDDPVVDYHNSVLFDSAMTAAGVRHRYVQFKTGGHGFGANPEKTTSEAISWKEDFINWLRILFK